VWVSTLLMHADNLTMPAPVIVSEFATGRRMQRWILRGTRPTASVKPPAQK